MIFKRIQRKLRFVLASGKTRHVIAFPELSLVIKFPVIKFRQTIFGNLKNIRNGDWKANLHLWRISVDNPYIGYKNDLFGGIRANWFEWRLYTTTHHKLLHPTWFSFFGLCNIAKYGEPIPYEGYFMGDIIKRVTVGASEKIGHGFETPANYTANY